jgi:hypothetical protein
VAMTADSLVDNSATLPPSSSFPAAPVPRSAF